MIDSCQQIEKLKEKIISALNNSGLTIGCAYYILKDVFLNMEREYLKALELEQNEDQTLQTEVKELDDITSIDNFEEKEFDLEDETE